MAMTVRISATPTCSSNRTRAHVAQLGDLRLNGGAAIFKFNQRVVHFAVSFA
jgi:hypothetical protein